MNKFTRRTYHSLSDFFVDIRFILANRPLLHKATRGGLVPFAFRERLMLVVTEVNGCRYCSYFHAKEALKAGITTEELKDLLAGCIPEEGPEEEYPALLYAQHWAESDAHPEPGVQQVLLETYGVEKSDAINTILRMQAQLNELTERVQGVEDENAKLEVELTRCRKGGGRRAV